MPSVKKYAIIVAGGSGKRMGTDTPKQFLELNNKPILMHSISAFFCCDNAIEIIVVLPENQIEYWKNLCQKHNFSINHTIIKGGNERFYSVKNGLSAIKSEGVVAIHDGARPLVSKGTIKRCYDIASQKGNAVPVVDIYETIRKIESPSSVIVPRNKYKLVQTPQCFLTNQILDAYELSFSTKFTDDACVVEAVGVTINLVKGNEENIKITTPFDLKIAQAFLN